MKRKGSFGCIGTLIFVIVGGVFVGIGFFGGIFVLLGAGAGLRTFVRRSGI